MVSEGGKEPCLAVLKSGDLGSVDGLLPIRPIGQDLLVAEEVDSTRAGEREHIR